MAESPRRVDLRLTIPAAAPFMDVAMELAEKFAEYAGANAKAAKALAVQLAAVLGPVREAQPDRPIDLELCAQDRELVVTARNGTTTTRATCPLPD